MASKKIRQKGVNFFVGKKSVSHLTQLGPLDVQGRMVTRSLRGPGIGSDRGFAADAGWKWPWLLGVETAENSGF